MNNYIVSNSDVEKIFNEEVWSDFSRHIEKTNNPVGFVLGGQPGAGKSQSIKQIQKKYFSDKKALVINGDEFRRFHPNFVEIQNKYGKEAANYTGQFAGAITEKMIDKAISEKVNIIVEGTFRTPEIPIKTLNQFQNNGYKTGVSITTTQGELSWASTQLRFKEMQEAGMPARYTPKPAHDVVLDNLAKNADTIQKEINPNFYQVFNREKELWNNEKGGQPGKFINEEINKHKQMTLSAENQVVMKKISDSIAKESGSFEEKESRYATARNIMTDLESKGAKFEHSKSAQVHKEKIVFQTDEYVIRVGDNNKAYIHSADNLNKDISMDDKAKNNKDFDNEKTELAKPGRTYTGDITEINKDQTIQTLATGKRIIHENKNLPGIKETDTGSKLKISYTAGGQGDIKSRDDKAVAHQKQTEKKHGLQLE